MLMVIGSFALHVGSMVLMLIVLCGMGIHSAFFGPVKYAILPDHLPRKDLLGATGIIEASTFLAILLGTTLGTLSIGTLGTSSYPATAMILFAAFAGLTASMFIPSTYSTVSNLPVDFHVWRATLRMLKHVHKERNILLPILAISWFWLIGAVILTKLPDYTHYILHANSIVFALFLALFSIGIALGSLMISIILDGRIVLTGVPWAMLGLTVFTFDLYLASPADIASTAPLLNILSFFSYLKHWRIAFDLLMLAFSAGLFVVPLCTYLQIASAPETRARTIAANNIYNALFMVLGTFLVMVMLHFAIAIPHVFLILSFLNLMVASGLWYCLRQQQTTVEPEEQVL